MAEPRKLSLLKCILKNKENIKNTVFDDVVGRSNLEKLVKHCHIGVIKEFGYRNFKVNGRWGFEIMYMCTEILSVVFSLLALTLRMLFYNFSMKNHIKKHYIGKLYRIQYFLGCITWISSSSFHIHETTINRNMDYFSALFFILYSFYMTVMRVLIELKISFPKLKRFGIRFFSFLLAVYLLFVYHMVFVNFNVYIHKRFCAVILVLTISSWMFLYLQIRNQQHAKYLFSNIILLLFSILIEASDLPPYFYLFDSHAAWHLMGCFMEYTYYKFLQNDILYLTNNK